MATREHCPDRETLKRLACGELTDVEVELLSGHVQQCVLCVEAMSSLEPADALLSDVRIALATSPDQVELPLERIERWWSLYSSSTGKDSTLSENAQATSSVTTFDFLAPPQQPDEIGRLGPYRVLSVLGSGGMGVVFRAEDVLLRRPVALKVIKPALAVDSHTRERFLREARSMAAVKHDHIAVMYQVGEDRGVPFLAMESLEGETLDSRLKRLGKLETGEVILIGLEVAKGLAAAHANGLIHRDIKPSNIWLEKRAHAEFRVKILDFGLARAVTGDSNITQTGGVVGTPAYMAPEQAEGEGVDHRSDLFSLGCVLYQACTGRLPFEGKNQMAIWKAQALREPAPPYQLNPAVPAAVSDLVLKLLAREAVDRPASCAEVVQTLEVLERDLPARSQPDTPDIQKAKSGPRLSGAGELPDSLRMRRRWYRRSRRYWLPLGVAVAVCLVVGVGMFSLGGWLHRDPRLAMVPERLATTPSGSQPDLAGPKDPAARQAEASGGGASDVVSGGSAAQLLSSTDSGDTLKGTLELKTGPLAVAKLKAAPKPNTDHSAAPDLVVYDHRKPPRSALAVRADPALHEQFAPERGALAIVLDCTGSMYENYEKHIQDFQKNGTPIPRYAKDTDCKWHKATAAVHDVLQKLPKGMTVSLWVYGHALDPVTGEPLVPIGLQGWPDKNQPDPRKNPLDTIKRFRDPAPWDPRELDRLVDRLKELHPYNETPLVRAMHHVKNTDFSPDFKGLKSLVVITDGMDNCFEPGIDGNGRYPGDVALHQLHGTSNLEEFIAKDFNDCGIRPILVGFQVKDPRERAALRRFETALKKLPLKGEYFYTEDAKTLVPRLRKDVQQEFRFQIEKEGGGFTWDDLPITRSDERNDFPIPLVPGTYIIRLATERNLAQRVRLQPGDYLRLKVDPNNTRNPFERVPYATTDYPLKPRRETEGWMLSVPQNQLKPSDRALEMMLTLESNLMLTLESNLITAPTLQVMRPARMWLEVKPRDVAQRIGVRWGYLSGYGAPAWDVRVSDWPNRPGGSEPARPVVKVWWSQDNKEAGLVGRIVPDANTDLSTLNKKELKIGKAVNDKVVIETVGVEDQRAEGAAEPVSALVVRLRYPVGKLAWVEIEGPALADAEYRFSSQDNKCTCIFWPLNRQDAQNILTALRVYSLEELKTRSNVAEIPLDSLPTATEQRPRPLPTFLPRQFGP